MVGMAGDGGDREELTDDRRKLRQDMLLDEALRESYPASDPSAVTIEDE